MARPTCVGRLIFRLEILKKKKKKNKKEKPSMLSLPSHLKFEKPITSLFYLKKSN